MRFSLQTFLLAVIAISILIGIVAREYVEEKKPHLEVRREATSYVVEIVHDGQRFQLITREDPITRNIFIGMNPTPDYKFNTSGAIVGTGSLIPMPSVTQLGPGSGIQLITSNDMDDLESACLKFVNAKFGGERDRFDREFEKQIESRVSDNGVTEQAAASDIAVDFFNDKQKEVIALKTTAVKNACMYFLYFRKHGYEIPKTISDALKDQTKDLIAFLKEEADG